MHRPGVKMPVKCKRSLFAVLLQNLRKLCRFHARVCRKVYQGKKEVAEFITNIFEAYFVMMRVIRIGPGS